MPEINRTNKQNGWIRLITAEDKNPEINDWIIRMA